MLASANKTAVPTQQRADTTARPSSSGMSAFSGLCFSDQECLRFCFEFWFRYAGLRPSSSHKQPRLGTARAEALTSFRNKFFQIEDEMNESINHVLQHRMLPSQLNPHKLLGRTCLNLHLLPRRRPFLRMYPTQPSINWLAKFKVSKPTTLEATACVQIFCRRFSLSSWNCSN